jgi:hypothetical protein
MYHSGIWNNKIDLQKKRLNSIFCYGNFDSKVYDDIKNTHFKVHSRIDLLNFFKGKSAYISLKNSEKITSDNQDFNEKYIFAIKDNFQIKMDNVRETLSNFNFYLCCPGVVMPLCHNVIEAMSVGTIPLIEKEYAEVMYPNLEHLKNAVIFENLEDLEKIISNEIFNFHKDDVSEMRKNVLDYYNNYLSPERVVENINESLQNKDLIYLQAEHRSVKMKIN